MVQTNEVTVLYLNAKCTCLQILTRIVFEGNMYFVQLCQRHAGYSVSSVGKMKRAIMYTCNIVE